MQIPRPLEFTLQCVITERIRKRFGIDQEI